MTVDDLINKMHPDDVSINHKFIFVIDGSWFLKSRVAVLGKNSDIDLSFETNEDKTRIAILSKLTLDLCSEISRMQYFIDDVIIAVDDKKANLWRSKHEYLKMDGVDTGAEDAGYKGTRTYDKVINWLKIYGIYFEWLDKMWNIHNVRNIKINEAEADDVIFMIAKYAMSKGRNVCWHGTDKDLTQICGVDINTGAIGIYAMIKNGNKSNNWSKTRLIACCNFAHTKMTKYAQTKAIVETPSIFDSMHSSVHKHPTNAYDAVVQYSDAISIEHTPSFLFYKIVLGDSGDNVPELFKNMKKRGQNEAHVSIGQIYNALSTLCIETDNDKPLKPGYRYMLQSDLYNEQIIDKFLTTLYLDFVKPKDNEVPKDKLELLHKRFAENRKLVSLNANEVPRHIIDAFMHTMQFVDFSISYADISKLCDYQQTIIALGLGATATSVNSGSADAKFAENFVQGLFN